MDICKYGDDIWFYAMALKNGYTVFKSKTIDKTGQDYIELGSPKEVALGIINTDAINCRNDVQIHNVFDRYSITQLIKKYNQNTL